MKFDLRRVGFAAATLVACSALVARGQVGELTVEAERPGPRISPTLYGLMTEEINHSYDGGLYAELISNRIFRDTKIVPPPARRRAGDPPAAPVPLNREAAPVPEQPFHWTLLTAGGAEGSMVVDAADPVNTVALTHSLRLDLKSLGDGGRVGVSNDGYWGIPLKLNTEYRASFYAHASAGFSGPINVSIESDEGSKSLASGTVAKVTPQWKRYEVTLKTGSIMPGTNNHFVLSVGSGGATGSVWFNLVSLMPPTFHDRPNGNRVDLMQLLEGMKPSFLRFPGGNYLEGDFFNERFAWKETIGPLEQRPGHNSPWRYRSSDGLGLLEFLDWCEDLKMQPVLAVFAGYALRGQHIEGGPQLQPYVDEALEEIEYVTGGPETKWGEQRAKDGHPQPFDLTYVEIGNEDMFDARGGPDTYDNRFTQFFDAIRAKYPKLQLIATTKVRTRRPDVIDDHYYRPALAMEKDAHHYDRTDRNGPKIFVGEWASREVPPDRTLTPSLHSALGDAAWMTGLERNSDVIVMSCYAPLLTNVNKGASQWDTDLIGYDALSSFGSPSYYVQAMFGQNRGDIVLPVTLSNATQGVPESAPAEGGATTSAAPAPPKAAAPVTGGGKSTGPAEAVFATASRDEASGDVIIKFVNTLGTPQKMHIVVRGVNFVTSANGWVVAGQPSDVNTIAEPTKVSTQPLNVSANVPDFTQEFPAYSANVIRLQTR